MTEVEWLELWRLIGEALLEYDGSSDPFRSFCEAKRLSEGVLRRDFGVSTEVLDNHTGNPNVKLLEGMKQKVEPDKHATQFERDEFSVRNETLEHAIKAIRIGAYVLDIGPPSKKGS